MDEMKMAMTSALLTNAKLARALSVFMSYHLSTKEKVSISKRIDSCHDVDELNGTMNLLDSELKKGYMDPQTGDKWSPVFVNDIKQYYEQGFPFNPLEEISSLFQPIKDYIILQEMALKMTENNNKELILKQLGEERVICNDSIKKLDELLLELRG